MLKRPHEFVFALMAGLLAVTAPAESALPLSVDGQSLPSLSPMLKRVTPGIVNISTKTQIQQAEHP